MLSVNNYNVLPWIEKYRPKKFDNIISHKNIISILNKYHKNTALPHLLFYGPPGTGKTSVILAYAKALYGKYSPYMVMELNASDERGIEVVRSRIKQFVASDNTLYSYNIKDKDKKNYFKLVILDETDAMTDDAQKILRSIVEKYTNNARFCLICNYIKKINPALQSRCTAFRFSPINNIDMKKKLKMILQKENVKSTSKGINLVIENSNGDMRKALNIIQSVSMSYNKISIKSVSSSLGCMKLVDLENIFNSLVYNDFTDSYNCITKLIYINSISLMDIITPIYKILYNMIYYEKPFNNILFSVSLSCKLICDLSMIEYNSFTSIYDNVQILSLIGLFNKFKKEINDNIKLLK
jgi:replication factor C subunit 3/5